MTYLANTDQLFAEFEYRTEQLRTGIARRRWRRTAARRADAPRQRRSNAGPRGVGD